MLSILCCCTISNTYHFRRVYQPVREIRNCPQQTNGFDCGIYVCLYVKIFTESPVLPKLLQYDKIQDNKQSGENSKLVEACIENITTTMLDILTPEMATEFRKDTIELVSQLSVEYRSRKQKM
jgi:Ulp1 family protease